MADGVRRIAGALYKRGEKEQKQAKEFFEKLDLNRDGKIDLPEFLKGVEPRLSHERIFKQLSSNADGSLNFDDVLILFHCKTNVIKILPCEGCRNLIFGPSFSCLECLFDSSHDGRFAVCCDCYGEGKFQHQHRLSPVDMFNDQALIDACKNRRTDDPKALAKKEMEKLSKIAASHYRAASPQVQSMAIDFFESMDTDGDKAVDLEEFLMFMRENGYTHMHNNHLFKMLDSDGHDRLNFWDIITLYYIIKSGRPFCDRCADFIPGIYFSCVDCFNDAKTSYNICLDCYESDKCKHKHDGARALFLDNFTLLQMERVGGNPKPAQVSKSTSGKAEVSIGVVKKQQLNRDVASKKSTVTGSPTLKDSDSVTDFMMNQLNRVVSQSQSKSKSKSTAMVVRTSSTPSNSQTHYANPQSSSKAMIKAPSPMKLASSTFKVLEAALVIHNLSTTLCTIL